MRVAHFGVENIKKRGNLLIGCDLWQAEQFGASWTLFPFLSRRFWACFSGINLEWIYWKYSYWSSALGPEALFLWWIEHPQRRFETESYWKVVKRITVSLPLELNVIEGCQSYQESGKQAGSTVNDHSLVIKIDRPCSQSSTFLRQSIPLWIYEPRGVQSATLMQSFNNPKIPEILLK